MSDKREIPIEIDDHKSVADVASSEDTLPETGVPPFTTPDAIDDTPPAFDPASFPDPPPLRQNAVGIEDLALPAVPVVGTPKPVRASEPSERKPSMTHAASERDHASIAATSAVSEAAPQTEPMPAAEPSSEKDASQEALESRILELEEELKASKNRMLRIAADAENYRRRAAREQEETRKFANETFLKGLLPVLDNLDRALSATQGEQNLDSLRQGVEMVFSELQKALTGFGVASLSAAGEKFDPEFHEAVLYAESEDVPAGYVVQEYQKGYFLNERLVRPALVIVSRGPVVVDAAADPVVDEAALEAESSDAVE